MKRDMELVRSIFRKVIEKGDLLPRPLVIEGYDDEEMVARHLEMLHEAGYLDAIVQRSVGRTHAVVHVRDLTWQGHEFAGALLTDETVWAKVKAAFGPEKLAIAPLKMIEAVTMDALSSWIKAQIDL